MCSNIKCCSLFLKTPNRCGMQLHQKSCRFVSGALMLTRLVTKTMNNISQYIYIYTYLLGAFGILCRYRWYCVPTYMWYCVRIVRAFDMEFWPSSCCASTWPRGRPCFCSSNKNMNKQQKIREILYKSIFGRISIFGFLLSIYQICQNGLDFDRFALLKTFASCVFLIVLRF